MIFLLSGNGDPIANKLAMDIIPWSVIGFLSVLGGFMCSAWLLYIIPISIFFVCIGFIAIFYAGWPLPSPLASATGQDRQDDG